MIIKKPNSIAYNNLKILVKQHGKHEIINMQNANQKQKYITGKYDLEVLSLPRLKIDDVEIKQSHTTKIEIPSPDNLHIHSAKERTCSRLFRIASSNHFPYIGAIVPSSRCREIYPFQKW